MTPKRSTHHILMMCLLNLISSTVDQHSSFSSNAMYLKRVIWLYLMALHPHWSFWWLPDSRIFLKASYILLLRKEIQLYLKHWMPGSAVVLQLLCFLENSTFLGSNFCMPKIFCVLELSRSQEFKLIKICTEQTVIKHTMSSFPWIMTVYNNYASVTGHK